PAGRAHRAVRRVRGQADHVHPADQSGLSGLTRRRRRVPYRRGPAGTTSGPGDAGKQAETEGNGSDCFMNYRLTLLPGDGVGPELTEATLRVLDATGVKIDWDVQIAGEEAVEKFGTPLPGQVLEPLRKNRVGLKGPITTPIGSGFRSVNVALRQELDLYASVRPCKTYEGVPSPFDDVDIVIVRENTEDLYAGVEFDVGAQEVARMREWAPGRIREDAAVSLKHK